MSSIEAPGRYALVHLFVTAHTGPSSVVFLARGELERGDRVVLGDSLPTFVRRARAGETPVGQVLDVPAKVTANAVVGAVGTVAEETAQVVRWAKAWRDGPGWMQDFPEHRALHDAVDRLRAAELGEALS